MCCGNEWRKSYVMYVMWGNSDEEKINEKGICIYIYRKALYSIYIYKYIYKLLLLSLKIVYLNGMYVL